MSVVRSTVKASLGADWPEWAVDEVIEEARDFTAEIHRPWVNIDVVLRKSVGYVMTSIDRALDRDPDLEADESWWDRWEGGKLEAEVEKALLDYSNT